MTDWDFIFQLRNLGVMLRSEGSRLLCNAPEGALTPELITELKNRKNNILKLLQQTENTGQAPLPPLEKASYSENAPLTVGQQSLWFLDQLYPAESAYNISWALRFSGNLDTDCFKHSLNELIRRHEALRTTIRWAGDEQVQVIAPSLELEIPILDFGHLPHVSTDHDLQKLLEIEALEPFDLGQGPLIRAILIWKNDHEYIFFLVIHHIIFDGWSLDIFISELFAIYDALHHGRQPQLPPLEVQYADYAFWQRKWLNEAELDRQIGYWKEKLGADLPQLELPADRPRPAVQTFNGAQESSWISEDLTQSLRRFAREEKASLYMVLLAVFKALLFRYSGQDDICIGSPFSGRTSKGTKSLIGFFVNTVVLRTDLSGEPSFRELLDRIREVVLEAQQHQEVPFARIVEALAPQRDLRKTPLFQVFFNQLTTQLTSKNNLSDLQVAVYGSYQGGTEAKFDLTFYVEDHEAKIKCRIVYNKDLFDAARIEAMLDQYRLLAQQVVEHPDENLTAFSLLTDAQRKRLPDPALPLNSLWVGGVHERFSALARQGAERLAIVDEAGSWSYGELERSSNQLAAYLRSKGDVSGNVVALYAHRSAGLVLALLGILKAGAAFLILDPSYPPRRLREILEEASPPGWIQMEAAGLIAPELSSFLEASKPLCRLQLPSSKEAIAALLGEEPAEPPAIDLSPDDLAYLIFTSGTTGRPKGVIGTHQPLSHFIDWHCRNFGFGPSDRFSMLSGLSHDPLLRDIFSPLWVGGILCIPRTDDMLMPVRLRSWMKTERVNIAHLTPAMEQVLTEGAEEVGSGEAMLSDLRRIFFGGDVLTWRHVEKAQEIAPRSNVSIFMAPPKRPKQWVIMWSMSG